MGADGCGMDSYGCGGVRGTGVQENKANRDADGHAGHAWYAMSALHQEGGPILKKTCFKKKTGKVQFCTWANAGGLWVMFKVRSVGAVLDN